MTTYENGKIAIVWDEKFEEKGKFFSRISLQTRDETGKATGRIHLSSDTNTFTHPVVLTLSESSVLVAYTKKQERGNEVWYQKVSFKEEASDTKISLK